MMQIAESAVAQLATNPELRAQMHDDPVGTLRELARPLQTDVWIYRGVIVFMGGAVILTVIGSIVLSFYGKPMSEGSIAIGSAAVGALAGLLAPSPAR